MDEGSAQHDWLLNDLQNNNQPWTFVVFHEPGWSAGSHTANSDITDIVQPLLLQYDIEMVFSGHNHFYSRALVDGVHHITSGGGGAPLYEPDPSYPYIVASEETLQYCTVEISGGTLNFKSIKPNGTIIDEVTITKNISTEPVLSSITIAPSAATIDIGQTQQFTAQGFDQYGNNYSVSESWSTNGGSISSSGLYTGSIGGTYTVTASFEGIGGTAIITVIDESSILTNIIISPSSAAIKLDETQQFTVEGYDQNGNIMVATPIWSVTGGSINSNSGLYTGSEVGNFIVSATQNGITATASVDVSNDPVGICEGGPTNGDYTYSASSEANNPSITFNPGYTGVGDNIVLIYYSTTESGSYPGYRAYPNTPFQISASEGETVYFYYTYSIPEGGERNTLNDRHSIVVGDCGGIIIQPILSSISVSPSTLTINTGEIQQFIATGYDQNGDIMIVSPEWFVTGGSIDGSGLYTGSIVGEFTITATSGSVSGNASIEVIDVPNPFLASIVVSPLSASINLNASQQYTTTGYDQYGDIMNISPIWSATGGYIDGAGLYTGTSTGEFIVTAASGSVSENANIVVIGDSPDCSVTASTFDYSAVVSNDANNPTITFVPSRAGVGDGIVILYYSTDQSGPYPGYITTPNSEFEINASSGQHIYFYYTYSLPEGGENNTANSRHDFVVGDCINLKGAGSIQESENAEFSVFPNPVGSILTVIVPNDINNLIIRDITGRDILINYIETETNQYEIDVANLPIGIYSISIVSDINISSKRFIKKH